MKTVSVHSQLPVRIVRSRMSALPTLLKSGCVFVARGTLVQSWIYVSNIDAQACSLRNALIGSSFVARPAGM